MNGRTVQIIRTVILLILAVVFLTYFWWLLLIPAGLIIWYYIKTKHELKKAEEELRRQMDNEVPLSDQIFRQQMKQKQEDIIDAEYTVHEEEL